MLTESLGNAGTFIRLLCVAALSCASLSAQPLINITVRVLDSRNGQPITHASVQALIDRADPGKFVWGHTDEAGIPYVEFDAKISVIAIHADPLGTFKYATCDAQHGWFFQTSWYAVSEILKTGIVAGANNCNRRSAVAQPGEFIVFLRPLHWWEKLRINP